MAKLRHDSAELARNRARRSREVRRAAGLDRARRRGRPDPTARSADWLDLGIRASGPIPDRRGSAPGGPPVQPARRLAGLRAEGPVAGAAEGAGGLVESGRRPEPRRRGRLVAPPVAAAVRLAASPPPCPPTPGPTAPWRSSGPTGRPGATWWRSTTASRATGPRSRSPRGARPGSGRPGTRPPPGARSAGPGRRTGPRGPSPTASSGRTGSGRGRVDPDRGPAPRAEALALLGQQDDGAGPASEVRLALPDGIEATPVEGSRALLLSAGRGKPTARLIPLGLPAARLPDRPGLDRRRRARGGRPPGRRGAAAMAPGPGLPGASPRRSGGP